ncbi:MAG: hypothetical protein M1834_005610 [Cirrosporium novae-zelandiae]|nr:MAG: hypothetical protein M1834_005610 [Cirrosporium novae-zelandiae]
MSQEWDIAPSPKNFISAVESILFKDNYLSTGVFVTDILDFALWIIGHDAHDDLDRGAWVTSSAKGQVIYPVLLESGILVDHGLLRLGGGPGRLIHSGTEYSKPKNLLKDKEEPDLRILWQAIEKETELQIAFGVMPGCMIFNPLHVLGTAVESIFAPYCAHESNRPLDFVDEEAYYITPFWLSQSLVLSLGSTKMLARNIGKEGVIAVAGNHALRFHSLVSNVPTVVRMNACLGCCLDLCLEAKYPYVVC